MDRQVPIARGDEPKVPRGASLGALCFRRHGSGPKLLLITERDAERWRLPVGVSDGSVPPDELVREAAWDAAGVRGEVNAAWSGSYVADRRFPGVHAQPGPVSVLALRVRDLSAHYPGARQFRRRWFAPAKAVQRVADRELSRLLAEFDPAVLVWPD